MLSGQCLNVIVFPPSGSRTVTVGPRRARIAYRPNTGRPVARATSRGSVHGARGRRPLSSFVRQWQVRTHLSESLPEPDERGYKRAPRRLSRARRHSRHGGSLPPRGGAPATRRLGVICQWTQGRLSGRRDLPVSSKTGALYYLYCTWPAECAHQLFWGSIRVFLTRKPTIF